MKEIVKEYKLEIVNSSNSLNLFRLPGVAKSQNPQDIKIKPICKLIEMKYSIPSKCASALKQKVLGAESITLKGLPTELASYYHAVVAENTIFLYPIQNSYIFQPKHENHPFEYTPSKIKKAESREEYEHRMKSLNYRLKNIDLESFKPITYEEGEFEPKITAAPQVDLSDKIDMGDLIKRIETTIKRTKVVNLSALNQLYGHENTVKSLLFRLTEKINGRFILKNAYYEKGLHDIRRKLLDLFRTSDSVAAYDVLFLNKENWLVTEIADLKDGIYKLRGYRESVDFDSASIREANMCSIKEIFSNSRVLSIENILSNISIDESSLIDLLQNENEFFHLSNNSYAINDPSFFLNDMFNLLTKKKSFELDELFKLLEQRTIPYDERELQEEIKKYCNARAGKFFLKQNKE